MYSVPRFNTLYVIGSKDKTTGVTLAHTFQYIICNRFKSIVGGFKSSALGFQYIICNRFKGAAGTTREIEYLFQYIICNRFKDFSLNI